MREYDSETLHKVQSIELSILSDFIDLCNKYDLAYFGMAGTGIGALRHGGFIPWDDDIDVALPRNDYEKFLDLVAIEFGDKYEILNCETNSNYPLMSTRMILRGTKFREYALRNIDCNFGIFLDIYAFDNIPDDERLFKKQARDAFIWSKLLILRSVSHPVLPFGGVKGKIITLACVIAHSLLSFFNVSKTFLYKKCYEASTRFRDMNDSKRLDYLCDTTPYSNIINRKDVFPLCLRSFENLEMSFPNNLDNYLRGMYGDYMTLPPEEKRKNHYPYELDFGKWA
ncbi:LicD family protein [Slackia isoflavoniconvertens]|uniref:LicD family protein n=1 Tax=Slackia isoflavoniconvertens TaxID=572010 RepID=A0A3N0I6Q9_9ACTN|nr:LicD family protein [Slackia isoflavoniconvertens]MBB3280002.1 lipopolysaccharide cholinephosphotransferase [Slackia isoflavoniconvertens]RNM32693.1 LicD family protein [Slackia isoflavoniconvertens]